MKLINKLLLLTCGALVAVATGTVPVLAKETVKLAFIGPLSGGNSAPGIGGRNSTQLAVQLRNADPSAKYIFELVTLGRRMQAEYRHPGRNQGRIGS